MSISQSVYIDLDYIASELVETKQLAHFLYELQKYLADENYIETSTSLKQIMLKIKTEGLK